MLQMKRVYEGSAPSDGYRILVDRIWPRGVSKERAKIDLWSKDITPTTAIRKAFGHIPANFPLFKRQYQAELSNNPAFPEFKQLVQQHLSQGETVTFVYAAKDPVYNHVVILKAAVEAND